MNKSSLHHSHRDYCGHGLWKIENGRFSVGAASDGDEFQEVVGFDDEESFIGASLTRAHLLGLTEILIN